MNDRPRRMFPLIGSLALASLGLTALIAGPGSHQPAARAGALAVRSGVSGPPCGIFVRCSPTSTATAVSASPTSTPTRTATSTTVVIPTPLADHSISAAGTYGGYDPCLSGTPDVTGGTGTTTIRVIETTDARGNLIYKSSVFYNGSLVYQGHTYHLMGAGSGQAPVATANSQGYIDGTVSVFFTTDNPALDFIQRAADRVYLNGATGIPDGDYYADNLAGATCSVPGDSL